jgi:hypothetical protein
MCVHKTFYYWCKCGEEAKRDNQDRRCDLAGTSKCKGWKNETVNFWYSSKECKECETKRLEKEKQKKAARKSLSDY